MTSEASREHVRDQLEDGPGPLGADLAALLGATITVLLTLTSSPGAWGPLATIIGLLLLVVLLAFFWGRRPEPKPEKDWSWQKFFVGFALSVVMGFVVAIASAQAIQSLWFGDDNPSECRSIAVAQAASAARDISEIDVKKISHIDPNKSPLQLDSEKSFLQNLIDNTLAGGHPTVTDTPTGEGAVEYAFYHQYDTTVGDCLAGEVFQSLWWIGVPALLLTLGWWYWKYITKFTASKIKPAQQTASH
jgi:H+/Cl- antiporter ClcA